MERANHSEGGNVMDTTGLGIWGSLCDVPFRVGRGGAFYKAFIYKTSSRSLGPLILTPSL